MTVNTTRTIASSNWRANRDAAASSTDQHDLRARSQSTPYMNSYAAMTANRTAAPITMIQGPPRAGTVSVSVTAERDRPLIQELHTGRMVSNLLALTFLNGKVFNGYNVEEWFGPVLAHVSSLLFVVSSTADVHFMEDMFKVPFLMNINLAITKIDLRGFHWFSGISSTRKTNPYFELCDKLPNLEEITLTLHNAGITTSCFGERKMIRLEGIEPDKARWRKVFTLEVIIAGYALDSILMFPRLRRVRLETVVCKRTAHHTQGTSAEETFKEVQKWLQRGFTRKDRKVVVELEQMGRE